MLSSFEEILLLDTDNTPIVDPSFVFDLTQYKRTGAMFWGDVCNFFSVRSEAWDLFNIARPALYPRFDSTISFTAGCDPSLPIEIQGGESLINKKRAWKGLMLTLFVSINHQFFMKKLFYGEKMTYAFAFNATETDYIIAEPEMHVLGRVARLKNGKDYFCGNTFAQRHPDTKEIVWLHRHGSKFNNAYEYLKHPKRLPPAWTHIGRQGKYSAWEPVRQEVDGKMKAPKSVFIAPPPLQQLCMHPLGSDFVFEPVHKNVCNHD